MTTLDTLIHLGAGLCRELDAHLALKPRRLVLVEADAQLADSLSSRAQGVDKLQVRNIAIAAQAGAVTFYRYNLPDANSIHPATGLKELFPGLREQQRLSLEATGVCELIESLQLSADVPNRLVIDLPGEELSCLQALSQCDKLHEMAWINLYCGHQTLYQGAATAKTILDWLTEQGFDVIEQDDSLDPDRPCWRLKRNPLKLECRALKAELTRQKEAGLQTQNKLNQLTKTFEQRTQENDQAQAKVNELTKTLEQRTQEKDQAQAKVNELTKTLEQRTQEKDQAQAKVNELTKTLEQRTQEKDQAQAKVNELTKTLEQRTQEKDQAQARVNELTKTLEQRTQEKTQAQGKIEELTKGLESAKSESAKQSKLATERAQQLDDLREAQAALQRDNALALRMQMMREADLKDLQQRHAEVVEQKDKQATLLEQLTERLTQASNYLHQLGGADDRTASMAADRPKEANQPREIQESEPESVTNAKCSKHAADESSESA